MNLHYLSYKRSKLGAVKSANDSNQLSKNLASTINSGTIEQTRQMQLNRPANHRLAQVVHRKRAAAIYPARKVV